MAVTIVTERDVELVSMIEDEIGAKMVELELPEEAVLEKLNAVSLARRMATMVRAHSFHAIAAKFLAGDARLGLWRTASDQ